MPRRRRLLWRFYRSFLLIVAAALGLSTWYAAGAFRDFYLKREAARLEAVSRVAEAQLSALLEHGEEAALGRAAADLDERAGARVTLILADGTVLADSRKDASLMENHSDRPEVREALLGRRSEAVRRSRTLDETMLYVAEPIVRAGKVVAVARVAVPISEIDAALRAVAARTAAGGLAAALGAALLTYLLARRVARPLEEMRTGAERFARGELVGKIAVPDADEIGGLADALNDMAAQLGDRIGDVTRRQSEQEAVLKSMVEGVLAVDPEERLLNVNAAAAELLRIKPEDALGRTIQEAVRNPDLHRFVGRALRSRGPAEGEIVLTDAGERFLQAAGAPLRDAQGRGIGAVVVLHDVTRLRRLENLRREFVANVSHELKTPVTSIKGYVETLLDGAVDDPENARRFLQVIARQSERLGAIIDDLLSLSRIEQDAERAEIKLEIGPVGEVLRAAVQACAPKAAEKGIRIDVRCPEDLRAPMNAPLLEQAVLNLIDNAVKYSEPGSSVETTARAEGAEVRIDVRDRGVGIEAEHLARIFERFYRVDKARSRKAGGTGLGLAIVKHICQAHGGSVEVESTPGAGSVFTIRLPLR